MMNRVSNLIFALFLGISPLSGPVWAQNSRAPALPAPAPNYPDVATLVLRSPTIVDAQIRQAQKLKGDEAIGTPPGLARLYVQADVLALIRGTDSLPAQISYLVDIVPDSRGRLPKLKKTRVLLYALASTARANQIRLTGPDSQRSWTAELDALTRSITREALAADAPPAITGIGNAFFVAGALPGEGETQIFLTTPENRPVSINVLHRPGEERRWAVSLSEIVDEAAAAPKRDTLLWYRLACFLPATLPATAVASLDTVAATTARADYQFIRQRLGSCASGQPAGDAPPIM
ncbi:MAG: hypothetical protein ACKVOB_03655 [Sphingomonas sp.]